MHNFEKLNPDTDNFIGRIEASAADAYVDAMAEIAIGVMRGNKSHVRDARLDLEKITAETMGMGEVLGASMALRAASAVAGREMSFAKEVGFSVDAHSLYFASAATDTIIPRFSFAEAVRDLIDRTPVTIRSAAERTAQAIREIYEGGRAIAFARSAEATVTKAVQKAITDMLIKGSDEIEAGRRIMKDANEARKRSRKWTEPYARTVFRNNVNTAVTAGRFRQTKDPAIKAILPAKQFMAVGDVNTRDNHSKANGLIWSVDNAIWAFMSTPIGHGCRCGLRDVSIPELRRMGRVLASGAIKQDKLPAGAGPDKGWRSTGRPDFFVESMIT
jgi:SPP1 gp7 family putative phage head morphogenesis protein